MTLDLRDSVKAPTTHSGDWIVAALLAMFAVGGFVTGYFVSGIVRLGAVECHSEAPVAKIVDTKLPPLPPLPECHDVDVTLPAVDRMAAGLDKISCHLDRMQVILDSMDRTFEDNSHVQ